LSTKGAAILFIVVPLKNMKFPSRARYGKTIP
jgi:hypothetical protein